jgi:hypothetical protein
VTAADATAAAARLAVDQCDACGRPHPAEFSHQGRFGEGPIYAVVCTRDYLTDYYTGERVAPAAVTRVAGLTGVDPLYWPCGRCRAESGDWCRSRTGRRTGLHVDRMQSVRLFQRYGAA